LATACVGKGLTMLMIQPVVTMRSTVELGSSKSYAKIIRAGVYLRILTGTHKRWSVEVTFREVRDHLGFESQRQWSDPAIARTTPCRPTPQMRLPWKAAE
jgi:hypothetical protein